MNEQINIDSFVKAFQAFWNGKRIVSLHSGEDYAIEDQEGWDTRFTSTEIAGQWEIYD